MRQIYNQSECNKRSIHRAITNSGAKSTLKFYADSPRMIPHGINPVCHRMPIAVTAYCAAQKPSRKRKSDGNDAGKSRKKKSAGENGDAVEDVEVDSEAVICDVDADSEQPVVKPSRRKKTKSSKKKSAGENGDAVEDVEVDSEAVICDVDADSEQPVVKPSRRKKTKSSKKKSTGEDGDPVDVERDSEVVQCDVDADSEQILVKPSRSKKTKSSKAKCVKRSGLVENVDTVSVAEDDASAAQRKRSADSLAEKLRSPLLQVIEAGDADDFDEHLDPPVKDHEPDVCDTGSLPFDHLSNRGMDVDLVRSDPDAENCGQVNQVVDELSSFGGRSNKDENHSNVISSSTFRSRVRTPPTVEETSAALQALEDVGRISPVDVMELVEHWRLEKPYAPRDSATDEDLPVFWIQSKPCRKVSNGEMVNGDTRRLSDGRGKISAECSSFRDQKPVREVVKTSGQIRQNKGSEECGKGEDLLRRHGSHTGAAWFEDGEDSGLPHVECNQISNHVSLKTAKSPSRHVPQPEDWKLRGNEDREKIEEKFEFPHPANISFRDPCAASEPHGFHTVPDKKLPQRQNLHLEDEFSEFDDTNDDEFLAAAVATPQTDRRLVHGGSANMSGVESQLTFTQALACVHDSIDVNRLCRESPRVHTESPRVCMERPSVLTENTRVHTTLDGGMVKSGKIDQPQFDLGFELSDDEDDDDDIVPPSPPSSSSWKSSIRLVGACTNSLITISRQNSCGSISASGHRTEDAAEIVGIGTERSESVAKDSGVRNTPVSSFVEHLPSKVESIIRSNSLAMENKSADLLPVSQPSTVAVAQKSYIVAAEKNVTPVSGAMDLKSGDWLSTMQLTAVEMEQKSSQQAATVLSTVAVDQKSPYPVFSNHVAVIRPSIRLLATPTTPAGQSEVVSPPTALSSSTPLKLSSDEKCGKFLLNDIN